MPDWLVPALAVLPTLLITFLGIGMPWALALLPRRDWRDPALVLALALALGPMLLTAAMFLLGTFARITLAGSLLAAAILAVWGAALAWIKGAALIPRPLPPQGSGVRARLATWEKLIVAALIVAALGRVIHAAFWPFTAYDVLWVYGYNARVFTLTGQIPAGTAYYPQMVPLAYTFAQMAWGGVDDHAARMVIPLLAWGSILAAYLLGSRLWSRRVGLLAAALWTFYPHHGQWAQFGDLEVPLTFFFTMAALFFVMAWNHQSSRPALRAEPGTGGEVYALLAGLMLGGALWIKPTAGALVWGIGLALIVEAARVRLDRSRLWPKVRLALIAGLAAAPIGGMWYVRNVLLGHPPLVFPPAYWLTQAQRSGQELGWPLLIAALLAVYLLLEAPDRRPDWRLLIPGAALLILGALPSAGVWVGTRTHPLQAGEIVVMLAGAGLVAAALWRRGPHPPAPSPSGSAEDRPSGRGGVSGLDSTPADSPSPFTERGSGGEVPAERGPGGTGWLIGALVLPYFVTWFWSYSYHPRLAFAITPLQLAIVAALIAGIGARLAVYVRPRRRQVMAAVALLCWIVPGTWLTFQSTIVHGLANDLPDDDAKQMNGNQALFETVQMLRQAEQQGPIEVYAPGALRLPFFFPLAPIHTGAVTDLAALDDRATHYVAGGENDGVYRDLGLSVNPVRSLAGQPQLAQSIRRVGDLDFWYEVFSVNTALRTVRPSFDAFPQPRVYAGFADALGYGIGTLEFWPGRTAYLTLFFRVNARTDHDYTIYLHVLGPDRAEPYVTWDHVPGLGQNPTYLWEPGTYVVDRLLVQIGPDVPPGDYRLRMGLYDTVTGERAPVQVDGPIADGFDIVQLRVLAAAPAGQ